MCVCVFVCVCVCVCVAALFEACGLMPALPAFGRKLQLLGPENGHLGNLGAGAYLDSLLGTQPGLIYSCQPHIVAAWS